MSGVAQQSMSTAIEADQSLCQSYLSGVLAASCVTQLDCGGNSWYGRMLQRKSCVRGRVLMYTPCFQLHFSCTQT